MKPSSLSDGAWEALWASFTGQAGSTWGDYVQMLSDNAAYLNRLGEQVVDVSQLLAFEFMQADGLGPLTSLSTSVDATVDAPGLSIVFSRSFPATISGRNVLGQLGYGWSHNWQYSLEQAADGTVTILGPGGSRRVFQPDSRYNGRYFSQTGDYSALTKLVDATFSLREPDGSLYSFSANGQLTYIEDTNGNRITCTYTNGLLTDLAHSSGQYLHIAYNGAGRITSVDDSMGRQMTYAYDAANEHLLSVHNYDGRVTSYSCITGQGPAYEHALRQITYPGNTHRYFTYDAQGHLSSISRDGEAERVTFAYDAGKVIATDALGNSAKFYFDQCGLFVKTEDALGNAVSLTFDDKYNLVKITDPAGRSYNYAYDTRGNLIRSTDPLGYVTRFSYTSDLNRLASVTDAKNSITRYSYDSDGNLQTITYADGNVESWGYDSLGQATSWTNRRGNVIGYAYDASGRIASKTYADGSSASYTYNTHGDLVSTNDPTGKTTFAYDANDYLIRIDYPGGQWLQFTYDVAGRRASSLDQTGHRLNYHYDAAGRLESLTNEANQLVVQYAYDAVGRLTQKTLGNGIYTTYGYDAAGQLLHLVNYNLDNSVLSHFDYTYDSRGRRTSMDTSYGIWSYEYDDLGQLTRAVLDSTDPTIPDQDLTYVYDSLGNRIRTIENGVTTEYTSNNMNQYTRVGDTTYVFDEDGNLIQEIAPEGTTTYSYNDENRLTSVTKDADTCQYIYDALGNRMATAENGVTINYVIDPIGLGNVVGEYDATGNLIAHYDYGLGLLSRKDALSNAYYVFDIIGNTQQLVIATGTVCNSYTYTPFGTLLQRIEATSNPFEYVGELGVLQEGNGKSYMRARTYDSLYGTFMQADPMLVIPPFKNRYTYASNNPIDFLDPMGLYTLKDWIIDKSKEWKKQDEIDTIYWDSRTGGAYTRFKLFRDALVEAFAMVNGIEVLKPSDFPQLPIAPDSIPPRSRPLPYPFTPYYPTPVPPTTTFYNSSSGNARPIDPNAKIGKAGYSLSGFISSQGAVSYRVDFENDHTADAPAQQVVITDQLNSNLDWSSFELTEIGFGDQFVAIPSGTQHYETSLPMNYNGVDFEVQILVELDLVTGRLVAQFFSVDSNTGLPPTVDIGFLPPEDGTGRGMGHISYIIQPKAGLPTGTEIRNIALISFDNQPAIATNQVDPHDPSKGTDPAKECLNTIDVGTPASQVNALPSEVNALSFAVSWSGSDDAGGSGVANYDIYVSDNGGSFVLWLDHTALTQQNFIGNSGHTYAFYSVTRDNVGHTESAPNQADATTTIVATAATVTFNQYGLPAGTSWSVTFGGITKTSTVGSLSFENMQAGAYSWTTPNQVSGSTGTRYVTLDTSGTINVPTQTFQDITYTTQYQVTYATNTAAGGTISPTSATWYNAGSQIAVTAAPKTGYSFYTWSSSSPSITIADSVSPVTTITVNGPGTVTANFALLVSGNKQLTLSGSNNILIITGGNNQINAAQAAATIIIKSGSGNNKITFGQGNNVFTSAASGNDQITTGNGDNTVTINANGNNQIVTGSGNDVITITSKGNNVINAGNGNNKVTVSSGNNKITTGTGNDNIQVNGNGNNIIKAGDGNNIVSINGNGNNQVTTGTGNDIINAGNGNNIISTAAGNDQITVGNGNNTIDGGAGYDVCIHGTGHNTILNCEKT